MNAHAKPETVTEDGEIVTTNALSTIDQSKSLAVSLARAEIDTQVATAHAFPRSIDRAVKNIMSLATLDDQTAEECIYALPRANKPVKGPSIRFAEIVQSQWGNCRVGARVVHVDRIEKYIEAEGVFHDLETNAATTSRVRRRISDKYGKIFSDDMIVVTGNAACSIAKRNAILGGIPKAAYRKAYDAVEQVIAGDVKTLSERRERAMKAFAAFGVTPEQVFAALSLRGMDDITLDHMATLAGMHSALKSGEATPEEMFAKPTQNPPKDLNGKLDELAKKKDETESAAASTPTAAEGEAGTPPNTTASPTPSSQPTAPQAEAATDHAAPDNSLDAPDKPATSGAAEVERWPTGRVPVNERDYATYCRLGWFLDIGGTIAPDAALTRWKDSDKALRSKCHVGGEMREELKDELDKIIAAKKAA